MCRQHLLIWYENALFFLFLLVDKHLNMVETSKKLDPNDPFDLNRFINAIKSRKEAIATQYRISLVVSNWFLASLNSRCSVSTGSTSHFSKVSKVIMPCSPNAIHALNNSICINQSSFGNIN